MMPKDRNSAQPFTLIKVYNCALIKLFSRKNSGGLNSTIKSNIVWGIIIKFVTTGLMFLIIKVNYSTLKVEKYGIWSTMYSLISWVVFLDLGISQGTRNLLAEAFAKGDNKHAQKIISTSYLLVGGVSLFLLLILWILPGSAYRYVLNLHGFDQHEVTQALQILIFFLTINFVLVITYSTLYALQQSAKVSLGPLIINLITLAAFLLFHRHNIQDLRLYAAVLGISFVISSLMMTFFTFHKKRNLVPSFHSFQTTLIKPILKIGFYFFLLQGLTVFIFSYVRILIFNFSGAIGAAKFDLYSRLYSVINIFALLVTNPLWSAFTHAYVNNDIQWINRALRRLNILMICLMATSIVLFFASESILEIWIKKSFPKDMCMNVLVLFTTLLTTWVTIYATLSNGINNLKPQLVCLLTGAIVNYPLSYFFCYTAGLHEHGVVLGQICSLLVYALYIPFNTQKFIKKRTFTIKEPIKAM